MAIFPSFLHLNNISLYIWHIFFIYSSSMMTDHLGYFPVLAIVYIAMNMRVEIYLWDNDIISFRYIPRRGIVGSYGSSIFNFLRKLHTIFHSASTSLHSHQQCTRVRFSLHPHQYLSFVFLITAILMGVRWYLLWFWFAFPWWLVMLNTLHVPVGHLNIFFGKKCLFRSFAHF